MFDLKKYLSENSVTTFQNSEFISQDENNDESLLLETLRSLAPQAGVTYVGYSEGVATFKTYTKTSVITLTDMLDNMNDIIGYEIDVVVSDPMSNAVFDKEEEFDFDNSAEFNQLLQYFIDVAIEPSIVQYDSVYISPNDDIDDDYSFIDSEIASDDSDSEYSTFDDIDSDSTPIVIKIASVKSKSPFGKYSASINTKQNIVTVGVTYSSKPSDDDLQYDINNINSGDFIPDFDQSFELVKSANRLSDNDSITATYKPKDHRKAITIVESLTTEDTVYFDTALHEVARLVKVNAKGKRRIKMQCNKGFKFDPIRNTCVQITGKEKAVSRISHRQAIRTKKSSGTAYQKKIVFRANKAKRFRKLMGI